MRKIAYIILIIFVLLFGILIGTPYLLSFFELDQKLKNYVVEKLSENSETILNVNNIDIQFGKIILGEIEYSSESSGANFQIQGLEFDYNLLVLLGNFDQPHRAINKIYLVEPTVIFKSVYKSGTMRTMRTDTTKNNILGILNQFDNIDRIYIKSGSFYLERNSGESLVLANNLNGWIDSHDFRHISLNADGDIFYGSNANLNMFCQVNLVEETFYLQIDLQDYDLRNAPLASFNEHIHLIDGVIDSKIDIKSNSIDLDSIRINGFVSLSQIKLDFFGTEFRDLEMHAQISDNKLVLNDGRGKVENSSFTVAAVIEDLFNPEIVGEIRTDRLETRTLTNYFNLEGFRNDNISLLGNFKIAPDKLSATADLKASRILFNEKEVKDVSAYITLENNKLYWEKFQFGVFDYEITGKSEINLSDGKFNTVIKGYRSYGEHYIFDRLSNARELIEVNVDGNFIKRGASGTWKYLVSGESDTVLLVDGLLDLKDDVFNFSNNRTDENDFLLSLQISDIYGTPMINYGYLENLPFDRLSSRKMFKGLLNKYDIEGILVGSFQELNAQISVVDRLIPERQFSITANVTDLMETRKNVSGILKFNKFQGEYNIDIGTNFLKGLIQSNHSLKGFVDINPDRLQPLQASLDFNKFEINKLFTDTTLSGYGEINGNLTVTGSLDDPRVNAAINGDRFIINDMGYYSFDLEMVADTSIFQLDTIRVALNNTNLLGGNLVVDYQSDTIRSVMHGENIDAEYLMQTLFNQKNLVTGTGGYKFSFEGSLLSPNFTGDIDLSNGVFEKIPFDNIHIQLRDSLSAGKQFLDYKNHHINISEFVAIKAGQYHLEGSGNLPLYDNGAIDLQLQFDGDLLWLIPNWDDFFIDGASFTTIRLAVSGTPRRPIIKEGYMEMERGELWLKEVAPHIENIQGKIYLEKNTNFIIIENLTAEIDEQKFSIKNEKSVTTVDGTTLAPWYFKDIDLNFGILALETSPEGIELHIPGLMVDGESGMLAVSGKGDADKFYLAGPVGAPHAWGQAQISDSRITFPLPPGDGEEPSNAIKFLSSIDWDVHVMPGKDLYYVRKVPSFFGEVNTELNIDPASDGLVFSGTIEDETLRPSGRLISSRGRIDYLDLNFRVEDFGFFINQGEGEPEVYGRAWTSVRDSLGATPKTIYLELYAVDEVTGAESRRARWEDFRFRLVSADPTVGESQEQVLAYLGYSVGNVRVKAKQVGGAVTDNYLIRPLLRPIERGLERYLGFDFVRVNAKVAENLLSAGSPSGTRLGPYNQDFTNSFMPYAFLIQSSEFTVGKYLTQDLYLTYTGQFVASAYENKNNFNLNHSLGIEYRFLKNLLFEFEYDREKLQYYNMYDDKSFQEDFRVRFRYSLSF